MTLLKILPLSLIASLVSCSETPENYTKPSDPSAFITGDVPLGNPDAPVKLVEYASLTCSHCRQFHKSILPKIKSEFIDSGKLVLIIREFPTSPTTLSTAQAMISRCAGPENFHAIISDFFDQQYDILEAAKTTGALGILNKISAKYGLDQEDVSSCIENTSLQNTVDNIISKAQAKGVSSTPTLFLNGKRLAANDMKLANLRKLILEAINSVSKKTP